MDFSGGTAIMLALAALLWFLYLLPTWIRRREYLATERNATRLQRTIRVMAEAAEVPDEVRLEATAREAAQRERLLREERRRADALARAELRVAAVRAREAEARAAAVEREARAAEARIAATSAGRVVTQPRIETPPAHEGLRRARRLAGLLLLAAIAVAAVQGWLVATTGAALGSWLVLAGCAATAIVSVALQRAMVRRRRALAAPVAAPVVRTRTRLLDAEPVAVEQSREWTPVPVPKPLYLERGEAPRVPVTPQVAAEELLRAAAEQAERALAAAHAEPEVVPFPVRRAVAASTAVAPAPAPEARPSRFASMGVIDSSESQLPDLDEVLRRRRSVG